ncbi:MAG: acyltransferase family protein [Micromonosporaceae bacterium]
MASTPAALQEKARNQGFTGDSPTPHNQPRLTDPGTTKAGSGGTDSGRTERPRVALLDNAKFLLIFLVVVGHAVELTPATPTGDAIYVWIYTFHMPAFVLIAGYLSRSFDGSAERVHRLLTTVVAPYLIFWVLYALQSLWVGRDLPDGPLEPIFLTWFLAALLVWRLTVPLWRRIPYPIPVSIGVSIAAGVVVTGNVLDVSRVLSLLPFFVTGLFLRPHHFEWLQRTWVRVCSAVVVLATAAVSYLWLEPLSLEWVYWRESLTERDFELLPYGLPARLVFLVIACAMTAAVLSLTPRRRLWITGMGAFTMYVFLLHGLALRIAEQLGWYKFTSALAGGMGNKAFVLNAALGVVLTFVLCTPWVRRATSWAVQPKADWILRRDDQPR